MQGPFNFISLCLSTVRSWLGLILPVLKKPADFRNWPGWVRVMLHLLVLGGVLYGLYWLSDRFDLAQKWLRTNENLWLPALFLCLYVLCWLLYWFILTLGEDDTVIEFPDVHDAWTRAVAQLADADIHLGDLPLFLILGKTASGDDALFKAAGLKDYHAAPGNQQAPVRVYAQRDALYVVCSGASGWGRFCGYLAGEAVPFDELEAGKPDLAKTLTPEAAAAAQHGPDKTLIDEMNQLIRLRTERPLTAEEQGRLQELSDLFRPQAASKAREPIPKKVLVNDQARLTYLCKLIKRDRRPWCPINGVLVLIPWKSLESEATNKEGYPVLNQELGMIRGTMDLRAPVLAMVCDLEGAAGFSEFRGCFQPEAIAKQRIGQRVPLVPEVPAAELPVLYESVAHWIGQNVLPKWVLQFLRVDQPSDLRRTPGVASPHNANLYLLLRDMYLRSPRLARTLGKTMTITEEGEKEAIPLFGGCYLAATGKTERETAFAAGVFSRLLESQNYVSWTPRAYEKDRHYGVMSMVLSALSLVLVLLVVGLLANFFPRGTSGRSARESPAKVESLAAR